jgi:hypothetical protein
VEEWVDLESVLTCQRVLVATVEALVSAPRGSL